ncbi:MAG: recombination mediator RecR [Candidatus Neomarinimicrobiota bacterium]
MFSLPSSVNKLIEELSNFPGIGKKTAQRLAFHILKTHKNKILSLSQSLKDVKSKIIFCSVCHGITELDPCVICNDEKRNSTLCIVEEAQDIFIFEKTNTFGCKYHVLGGALSPLDGIGPEELNIDSLLQRIQPNMEIIVATNSNIEGETTSLYLNKVLSNFKKIKVTRLARGLPVGGDLEYIDEATLIRAMEGRTSI